MTKWYEPIECANTVADPLVATEDFFGGIDPWLLREGRPCDDWDESFWLRAASRDDDGDPDDVLQTHIGRLPIYSGRLRDALEAAGVTGIQYLPVRVYHHDGTLVPGFAVANLLHVLPALDLARSRYSRYGDDRPDRKGQIRGVREAVLKREVVEGYDIIRLKEFPLFICVSQRFKETFDAGGFTGYRFYELGVA
jgi:hypothetical protein